MMSDHNNHGEKTAEAEIKIRLNAGEFARLPGALAELGFAPAGEETLTDYYLDYSRSPHGGYDFTRLREIDGGKFLLTRKNWIRDTAGQAIRLEEERELDTEEAERLLRESTARTLHKQRREYRGRIGGQLATIDIDALELAGTGQYFLECEMLVSPDRAAQAREDILAWMRSKLPVSDLTEAPSMLELLLKS